ncbi:MAG TPA: DUF3866 family protein [Gaiellaceae bacterium]|nr:DUF3866 family protein [Gaiellaceae bacterium]
MPLSLRRGTVSAVREQNEELIRLVVDGEPCLAYPRLTGPVAIGDEVIVNTQARDLGLGSGGFDVLYANLTRGIGLVAEPGAHVMTLLYTPLQAVTPYVEEDGDLAAGLDGTPVVCCSLHSQVAPVCAGLRRRHRLRVAYVQVGGGALPVSLSDALRTLRGGGYLEVAVAVAPCLDGDVQAVTAASALAWCSAQSFDAVVCSIGPGIVGTATALGHGGLVAVDVANTAAALGGSPILAVRYSEADARERHQGVSHHTRAILELSATEPAVAWPHGLEAPEWLSNREEVDVEGWHEECGRLPLSHMGRSLEEDPGFFMCGFAAGELARLRVAA